MKKAKFKVGQVVYCTFLIDADAYGIITGFDDERWHVQIREREHKIPEHCLRPLTQRERGQQEREQGKPEGGKG